MCCCAANDCWLSCIVCLKFVIDIIIIVTSFARCMQLTFIVNLPIFNDNIDYEHILREHTELNERNKKYALFPNRAWLMHMCPTEREKSIRYTKKTPFSLFSIVVSRCKQNTDFETGNFCLHIECTLSTCVNKFIVFYFSLSFSLFLSQPSTMMHTKYFQTDAHTNIYLFYGIQRVQSLRIYKCLCIANAHKIDHRNQLKKKWQLCQHFQMTMYVHF